MKYLKILGRIVIFSGIVLAAYFFLLHGWISYFFLEEPDCMGVFSDNCVYDDCLGRSFSPLISRLVSPILIWLILLIIYLGGDL